VRLARATSTLLVVVCVCLDAFCSAQEGEQLEPFVRLYDTVAPIGEQGIADALPAAPGWQLVPEGDTAHQFAGDAVIRNDRLAVLLRRGGGTADLYSQAAEGWVLRSKLSADPPIRGGLVRVAENAASAVEAALGAEPASLTCRLTLGEPIARVTAGEKVKFLEVKGDMAQVLLPEFFADDLVYSPQTLARDVVPVPADNQVLALTEAPRGILMCLWRESGRATSILSKADADGRQITGLRLPGGRNAQIWLACLEIPGIWRSADRAPEAAPGESDDAEPFPALWRVSSPGAPSLGMAPRGGYVVYALDRTKETPLTVYCPVDVLRNTLGCGPCQYVLDAEGAGAEQQVTPDSVADWVEQQFARGRQERRADQIDERLKAAVAHVQWMADRLTGYEGLGTRILAALAGEGPQDDPAAAPLVRLAAGLRSEATTLDYGLEVTARAAAIAGRLAQLARAGGGADEAAKLCDDLRAVGAAQDRALAKCRLTVRRMRLARQELANAAQAAALTVELDRFQAGR
jgi:hypothetical protein